MFPPRNRTGFRLLMANSIPRYLAHSILRAVATFCEVSLVVALQLASYGLELRAGFLVRFPCVLFFVSLSAALQ